jgi:hypothetical protein
VIRAIARNTRVLCQMSHTAPHALMNADTPSVLYTTPLLPPFHAVNKPAKLFTCKFAIKTLRMRA